MGNQRPEIYFFLTELQRVEGIKFSGTSGGDFSAAILDVQPASFNDLSGNPSLESLNITLSESADRKAPEILNDIHRLQQRDNDIYSVRNVAGSCSL